MRIKHFTTIVLGFSLITPVFAQTEHHHGMQHDDHSQHMQTMPATEMDHSKHMAGDQDAADDHSGHMPQAQSTTTDHSQHMSGTDSMNMDHGAMQHESMDGNASATLRDPHAYSGGFDFGPIPRPVLADEHTFGFLLMDTFEAVQTDDEVLGAYSLYGWWGRDINRIVIKSEGEGSQEDLHDASMELHWGRALNTFWNTQLGFRYDTGDAPDKTWLAAGIQGLAPYWFELDATAYVDADARVALRFEAEYELLFTQRLILQPVIETNIYSKADTERAIGSGLSDLTAGLRLRYEIRRQFAPYIGVQWTGTFGDTADQRDAVGADTSELNAVAGLRFWF